MSRQDLYTVLNSKYPTFGVGQNTDNFVSPYLVVKYNNQSRSINNKEAGWQVFEVMCYVPYNDENNSILPIDTMLEVVREALQDNYEPTGNVTPDYIDTDKKCAMRSIEFRIPKEV